jgi:hypothetical protein
MCVPAAGVCVVYDGEQAAGAVEEEAKELALTEQARRNYRKVADWQEDGGVVYKIVVWQLGDIFVVAVPGEPYSELQVRSPTRSRLHMLCTVACVTFLKSLTAVCVDDALDTDHDPRGSSGEACHRFRQHERIPHSGLHSPCRRLRLRCLSRQNRCGAPTRQDQERTDATLDAFCPHNNHCIQTGTAIALVIYDRF